MVFSYLVKSFCDTENCLIYTVCKTLSSFHETLYACIGYLDVHLKIFFKMCFSQGKVSTFLDNGKHACLRGYPRHKEKYLLQFGYIVSWVPSCAAAPC
jgi:hypothetical protein